MRKIAEALRGDFVISHRPAWGYGLLCALGICLPLLLGVVLGHVPQGAAMALGAISRSSGTPPACRTASAPASCSWPRSWSHWVPASVR